MSIFQRIKAPFTESGDDEIAAAMPRPRPVGELLRERREELRLDINDVGEILRIKPAFLAAIEESRPQDLPGPTYVIGFVRAYAQHLGLDHDWVLQRYKAESAGIHLRPDLALPVLLGERSVPGGPILLVALILAICGYGTWYYLSTGERARPERVTAVPPALQMQPEKATAAPDKDAGGTASSSPALDTAASGAKPAADTAAPNPANPRLSSGLFAGSAEATTSGHATAPPATASPGAPPPAGSATSPPVPLPGATAKSPASPQTAGAAPQAPPAPPQTATAALQAPPAPAPPSGDSSTATAGRIEIRATADCWVQVRAPDQSIVFSRVLKAGETYRVPARSGLMMRTGNAGALAITVDGKTVPSLGPVGTLRRSVVLEPAALLGGTAVQG